MHFLIKFAIYKRSILMKIRSYKLFALLIFVFLISISFHAGLKDTAGNEIIEISPDLKRHLFLPPELIEEYQEKMTAILEKHHFNGNILLALNGRLVYESSQGYADFMTRTLLNEQSVFQLASVSKQFTAMGIALLREDGLLGYDDFVRTFIPEFPYPNITIRHLLNHTSGLQNYVWLLDNEWHQNYFPNNEDLVRLFAEKPLPLNFVPGNRFSYTNTGYAFLASVIERVSGESYAAFLKKRLFDPLHMHDTYVYNKALMDTLSMKTKGHVRRGRGYVVYDDDNNDGILGDKGIYSTSKDLFLWDNALYGDYLLPQESLALLFEKQTTTRKDTLNYGLGWRLPKNEHPAMVYHNGWWHGYRTTFRRFTEDRHTLIVLNNTNTNIFPLINDIQGLLYPEIQNDTLLLE